MKMSRRERESERKENDEYELRQIGDAGLRAENETPPICSRTGEMEVIKHTAMCIYIYFPHRTLKRKKKKEKQVK